MTATNVLVADYLATQGLGTRGGSVDWSIFDGTEPPEPDKTLTVYNTPGGDPVHIESNLRAPGFQLRARAFVESECWNKLEAARALLCDPESLTLGGQYFVGIFLRGDFNSLGRDDSERIILVANFDTIREVEAS